MGNSMRSGPKAKGHCLGAVVLHQGTSGQVWRWLSEGVRVGNRRGKKCCGL